MSIICLFGCLTCFYFVNVSWFLCTTILPLMHQRLQIPSSHLWTERKLITWLHYSTGLNPTEQFRLILKKVVCKGGQQFTSKDAHWKKIFDVDSTITSSQINRLLRVISRIESSVDKMILFCGAYLVNSSLQVILIVNII